MKFTIFAYVAMVILSVAMVANVASAGVPPTNGQGTLTISRSGLSLGEIACVKRDVIAAVVVNCALPTPAPACTAGQTICMEGNRCQATVFTCAGAPGAWGAGVQCSYNACAQNPGSVGSKCQ